MEDVVRANERDFKGVYIPKEIWCNRAFSAEMKLMWGEIFALDNDFGCTADNEHFCRIFGWFQKGDEGTPDVRKAQRIIKQLKDADHIIVELDKAKNTRTIRIVGKYRHLDQNEMSNLAALRAELTRSKRM